MKVFRSSRAHSTSPDALIVAIRGLLSFSANCKGGPAGCSGPKPVVIPPSVLRFHSIQSGLIADEAATMEDCR